MQILSSVSSDFQTLIKHQFPLYFLNELLMSLRNITSRLSSTHRLNESSDLFTFYLMKEKISVSYLY